MVVKSELLAERKYLLASGGRSEETVVQMSAPRQRAEDGRWICRAAVIEESGASVKPMNGVDAFEAIQLVLELIGVELRFIAETKQGILTWLDGRQTGVCTPSFCD